MSRLAIITFITPQGGDIDNTLPGVPVYPGNALPGGGANLPGWGGGWGSGNYPGNALPGSPGHPGNALPPPGQIITLPVFPFDPTKPPSGGRPDNTLPGGGDGESEPPDASTKPIVPGRRFIVKWLACYGLILVPDNELPETPEPK